MLRGAASLFDINAKHAHDDKRSASHYRWSEHAREAYAMAEAMSRGARASEYVAVDPNVLALADKLWREAYPAREHFEVFIVRAQQELAGG